MSSVLEIRKQIKSGKTGPLYLLEGDDLQSRHDLAIEFANIVDEGLQAFNVQSFYANEATNAAGRDQLIGSLLSNARTLPMMAPRRVIVVHEADRLLAPKRAKDEDEADVTQPTSGKASGGKRAASTPAEELEAYIEKPEPMTTMVFVSGPLDANRRVVKLLRKHADVVDCGTLHDPREAAMWITKRLEKDELTIDPKAISLLLSTTGLTLGRIRPEIEKLILYAAGESTITAAHVKEVVIPQEESEGTFALMDAVQNANAARALREVSALIDGEVQPPVILGQLRAATIRLRGDARVKNGLEAVFRTDMAIKSSSGTPRHLLECLVVELCAR
ncbi:MAG: DNA polymerase III subunit delta [Cyanobacteria bacterium]|nr:DNA polymerase III subunit delta [Cyanobacteriota bacterium]